MSKMKDEWLNQNDSIDELDKPEYVQAGITRETLQKMQDWINNIQDANLGSCGCGDCGCGDVDD